VGCQRCVAPFLPLLEAGARTISTHMRGREMTTNTLLDMQRQAGTIRDVTRRVQAEYSEMPGLSVTLSQAQRLLDIDRPTCTTVFQTLVQQGVLRRTAQGRYIRA
jgi:Fic family protein